MTDVRKTPYQAELQIALDTDLNGDVNDTWSPLSAEIDNSTNGYLSIDVEVYLAAPASAWAGADSAYEIYLVPSLDGTNFPDYVASGVAAEQENNQYYVGAITTQGAGTVACRQVVRNIELPPGKWKLGGRNVTNQTLAATLNTIKWRPHSYASV